MSGMPLTKKEKEMLARLEHQVGMIAGFMAGGPMGARMSRPVVDLFQESPFNQAYKEMLFATLPDRRQTLDGFAPQNSGVLSPPNVPLVVPAPKKKRKPSAYNKRYSKCFKKLAPKYKKKNGGWKKDGFARCSKAARKCAK